MNRRSRGFTLVEILIVVIILGILAAIVIPQFGSSTGDAKASSVKTTLNSLRNQIELFRSQHNDTPPDITALAVVLTGRTTTVDTTQCPATLTTASTGFFGPYIQYFPVNPINGWTSHTNAAQSGYGWVYTTSAGGQYSLWALDTTAATTLPY